MTIPHKTLTTMSYNKDRRSKSETEDKRTSLCTVNLSVLSGMEAVTVLQQTQFDGEVGVSGWEKIILKLCARFGSRADFETSLGMRGGKKEYFQPPCPTETYFACV